MNKQEVVKHLVSISELYVKLDDTIRASSFSRASKAILDLTIDEIENVNQLNGLKGVGASTKKVVEDLLNTGTSERFHNLNEQLKSVDNTSSIEKASSILKRFKR